MSEQQSETPPSHDAEHQPLGEKQRWIGYIDAIHTDHIAGWACDQNHPDDTVAVEAIAMSGKRVVAITGFFRQDIKDAGFGNGNHGFALGIKSFRPEDGPITIRFLESKVPISHEPIELDPQNGLLMSEMPEGFRNQMRILAVTIRQRYFERISDRFHP